MKGGFIGYKLKHTEVGLMGRSRSVTRSSRDSCQGQSQSGRKRVDTLSDGNGEVEL